MSLANFWKGRGVGRTHDPRARKTVGRMSWYVKTDLHLLLKRKQLKMSLSSVSKLRRTSDCKEKIIHDSIKNEQLKVKLG